VTKHEIVSSVDASFLEQFLIAALMKYRGECADLFSLTPPDSHPYRIQIVFRRGGTSLYDFPSEQLARDFCEKEGGLAIAAQEGIFFFYARAGR